ncbi:FecCD family ABC transporter permease [Mobilicoccus massiliensis]|uniref:FecCD family ABC transporter permease n=1 Tax=Mobilicoccus massiliensis TaxID=1522310 RepID=UPI0005903B72|nr:iron chelate uptake ABC transporter family permease subunit [Mobilicoccus massiliensis]
MSTAVTLPAGPVRLRVHPRALVVSAVVLAVTAACAVWALTLGAFHVPAADVVRALTGRAGDALGGTIVLEWRLPRVVAAIVFGMALGVSGAVFQTLTRNPLGSPDIIGFNTGAYTGALVAIVVLGGSFAAIVAGALVGGLATALVVVALVWRHGTQGFRLILVGIGISAMLTAVNHWLILTGELETAVSAAVWGAGSLNGVRWSAAAPSCVLVLVVLLVTGLTARHLAMLDLSDDHASSLGLARGRVRLVLLVLATVLTAAPTAVAGPIAFVALAAPQIGRRLAGAPGIPLLPAAATGGLLLLLGDVAGQHLFTPIALPVGVVTVAVGGVYLVWLLAKEARR